MLASTGASGADPTFVKDILPVLNKAGCTSGTCHGSAKGKNGFKLSLRGYDAEFDYRVVLHDMAGRRVNRVDPERSLILLKPAQQLPHGGGLRLEPGSSYYNAIVEWIKRGAPFGSLESARVKNLEVEPPEFFAEKPGPRVQLKLVAHYADGSTRDVTRESHYTSNTPQVAEAGETGEIVTLRKGETAVLARYEGRLAVVPVTLLDGRSGFSWKAAPEWNYIDRLVNAKLRKLHVLPSDLATDAEFLRRASLDLTGVPATPEEVRAFLADQTGTRLKRSRMIDSLMARKEFVNHWSVKFGDLLQTTRAKLGEKGVWAFREWIRESLAAGKPYDQMARELLTARGSTYRNPPANYYRFTREPKLAMETATQLFLGVRMVCAQCHDHPFERWTQNQYYQLTAFFGSVGVKNGAESDEEIVYDKTKDTEVRHPKDGHVVGPKFLFDGGGIKIQQDDPRESLAAWITSRDNPFFAKAMANRLWSYFLGRGIIEPTDDIRATNPPTNPELLDALTRDFVTRNFDLRHVIRTIVSSRTYQLSSQTNQWNADDEINFSHAMPRRLSAEQLYDSIHVAAGARPSFGGIPEGWKAQDVPDPFVGQGGFLDIFGRPERQTSCECERRSDMSLVQALNLLNGSTISDAIGAEDGRIAKLILSGASDRKIVEQLYLAALGRPPELSERDFAQTYLARGRNRGERAQDLLWALINSNAFLFNR